MHDETGSSSLATAPNEDGHDVDAAQRNSGYKLFLGQLPRGLKESELREMMIKYGPIVEMTILRCKSSQKGRGCGFCTYEDEESAAAAITDLHERRVFADMKNAMQVKYANRKSKDRETKLFVGQLPRTVNDAELEAVFSEHSTVVEARVLRRGQHSRGCGFVRFAETADAEAAAAATNEGFIFKGQVVPLNVRFAEDAKEKQTRKQQRRRERLGDAGPSQAQNSNVRSMAVLNSYHNAAYMQDMSIPYGQMIPLRDMEQVNTVGIYPYGSGLQNAQPAYSPTHAARPRRGPPRCNLFVFNIPHEWTDQNLVEAFIPFGNVISSKVYIDKETKRSKGFGFVSFSTPQAADLAIQRMNDTVLPNGKMLKVSLKSDQPAQSARTGTLRGSTHSKDSSRRSLAEQSRTHGVSRAVPENLTSLHGQAGDGGLPASAIPELDARVQMAPQPSDGALIVPDGADDAAAAAAAAVAAAASATGSAAGHLPDLAPLPTASPQAPPTILVAPTPAHHHGSVN